MTDKEQAIKNAYGEHWKKVGDYVNLGNGLCDSNQKTDYLSLDKSFKIIYSSAGYWHNKYIPKSLEGLETNNNWITIKSESNLPKERKNDDVFVFCNDGSVQIASTYMLNNDSVKRHWLKNISHYQPIIKPKPPIC